MKTYIYFLLTFFFVGNLHGQEKTKDTLFFKYDKFYIEESTTHLNEFYLKDRNSDEMFFFRKTAILYNLKPKEILCLKKTIRQPQFYNKTKKQKLSNYRLMMYFRGKISYLVRKKNGRTEYLGIEPVVVISD